MDTEAFQDFIKYAMRFKSSSLANEVPEDAVDRYVKAKYGELGIKQE